MPPPLYGQAVITDRAGLLYTVGGTSGFTYFMDVHRLDLTQKPPRHCSPLSLVESFPSVACLSSLMSTRDFGTQNTPYCWYFACSSLVLYGIRIVGPIIGALMP